MNNINFLRMATMLVIVMSSCSSDSEKKTFNNQASENYGDKLGAAASIDGCMSSLEINFYGKNQYVARYSTDVGRADNIVYSGFYEFYGDDSFALSSPIYGRVSFKADEHGIFMPENYSVEKGMNSGLRLKIVSPVVKIR